LSSVIIHIFIIFSYDLLATIMSIYCGENAVGPALEVVPVPPEPEVPPPPLEILPLNE
jgi:hypothetical protein